MESEYAGGGAERVAERVAREDRGTGVTSLMLGSEAATRMLENMVRVWCVVVCCGEVKRGVVACLSCCGSVMGVN